ncbi:hypothetical protein M3668_00130 [Rothia sp. P100]|uniref:hypothetical protein n=1 Tax=Rothia sp. P100 TaxID=2939578 RepID=UPI00203FFD51|nr:hypothetical protein [Rothia sp. P100]MCM3509203.1 hypothetical protein [Rothia sp. P100]
MNAHKPIFTATQLETAEEVIGSIANKIERAPKPGWNEPMVVIPITKPSYWQVQKTALEKCKDTDNA